MIVSEAFIPLQSMKNVLQQLSVSVLSLAIGKLAFLKEQGVYCKQD
jgi:hypothetical protein